MSLSCQCVTRTCVSLADVTGTTSCGRSKLQWVFLAHAVCTNKLFLHVGCERKLTDETLQVLSNLVKREQFFYQHYFLAKFKSRKTQFSRILNYDVQLKHIVRYLKVYLHVHVCDRSMVLFARPRHLCMIRGWQHIRSSSKSFGFCALFVARSTLQHKPYVRTLTIRKVEFVRLRYSDTSSVTAYIYTQIDIIHISLWCAHSHSHRPFIRALRKKLHQLRSHTIANVERKKNRQ